MEMLCDPRSLLVYNNSVYYPRGAILVYTNNSVYYPRGVTGVQPCQRGVTGGHIYITYTHISWGSLILGALFGLH